LWPLLLPPAGVWLLLLPYAGILLALAADTGGVTQ
jgi:hypothetical protein